LRFLVSRKLIISNKKTGRELLGLQRWNLLWRGWSGCVRGLPSWHRFRLRLDGLSGLRDGELSGPILVELPGLPARPVFGP
jgi:hypothetical protein